MLEAPAEANLSTATAKEAVDGEEKIYSLSPPKALFTPSPNHPLHILVSKYSLIVIESECVELWS